MVVNVDEFKENPEGILSDALEYGEPVILKTGLGNFIVLPETEFQSAFAPADNELETTLFNIR